MSTQHLVKHNNMKKYSNDIYADPNGVKRWDLINHLIKNYNFLNYLEKP